MSDVAPLERIDSFPYRHRIADVMSTPVLTAPQSMPVIQAIQAMAAARVSSVVVVDDEGRGVGIVTGPDILGRIGAGARSVLDGTLGQIMSHPLATVDPEALVYVALAKMTRKSYRHLVVADAARRPVGVVTARSLLKVRATDALVLEDTLDEALGAEDMRRAVGSLPRLVRGLLGEGVSARNIASVIGLFLRDLTARAAELSAEAMAEDGWGGPPAACALLVLGSAGRGESLLVFDQDNAIVHAGTEADDPWFAELGRRVNTMLNEAGIPLCDGKVMAGERMWRRSLDEWHEEIRRWVFALENQTAMYCDIFFDFQPVWGDFALAERLRAHAIETASQSGFFLQYLGRNVAQMEDALGMFGRFRTLHGRMNVKKLALLPLTAAARLRAIRAKITATSTDERFAAVAAQGHLHEDDRRDFADVREIILKAMLEQQLADLAVGAAPSARIDPDQFDKRDRQRLRWALGRLSALRHACGVGG